MVDSEWDETKLFSYKSNSCITDVYSFACLSFAKSSEKLNLSCTLPLALTETTTTLGSAAMYTHGNYATLPHGSIMKDM